MRRSYRAIALVPMLLMFGFRAILYDDFDAIILIRFMLTLALTGRP